MLKNVFSLIRRAWLPLLLACALLTGVELATTLALDPVVKDMAARVEATKPEGPSPEEMLAGNLDFPEDYDVFAWWDYRDAVEAHNDRVRLLRQVKDLPGFLLSPVLLLGLYRVLLTRVRGEESSLWQVFGGFLRGGRRALWMEILISLRMVGWTLLAMLPAVLLILTMSGVGEVLSAIWIIPVAVYLDYRYALSRLHLADGDMDMTAGDCIRYGIEDLQTMPVPSILLTLWPMLAALAAQFILTLALPESWWATAIDLALTAFIFLVRHAGMAVIYQHIRDVQAAKAHPRGGRGPPARHRPCPKRMTKGGPLMELDLANKSAGASPRLSRFG